MRLADLAIGTARAEVGSGCETVRFGLIVTCGETLGRLMVAFESLNMNGGRSTPSSVSSRGSSRGILDRPKKESRFLAVLVALAGTRGKPQAFIRFTFGSSAVSSVSGSGVAGVTIGVGIEGVGRAVESGSSSVAG